MFVVRHVSHAVLHVDVDFHSLALELRTDLHAHRVQSFVGLLHIPEDKGKIEDRHFGKEISQHGRAGEGEVNGAELGSLDEIALIAGWLLGKT